MVLSQLRRGNVRTCQENQMLDMKSAIKDDSNIGFLVVKVAHFVPSKRSFDEKAGTLML